MTRYEGVFKENNNIIEHKARKVSPGRRVPGI